METCEGEGGGGKGGEGERVEGTVVDKFQKDDGCLVHGSSTKLGVIRYHNDDYKDLLECYAITVPR